MGVLTSTPPYAPLNTAGTLTPKPQGSYPSNGWWVVRDANGALGLVKGSTPGANAVHSQYVGAANTINDLATHLGTQLSDALGASGANPQQQADLITQLDVAAGKFPKTARIFVARTVKPGTNGGVTATDASGNPISTTPSGDAANAGISMPGVSGLTGVAIRVLEAVGGILLLVIGLRALLGGGFA